MNNYPRKRPRELAIVALVLCPLSACNSIKNGWLDPTVVGEFRRESTTAIRSSLSLEDSPSSIPGAEFPVRSDHEIHRIDFPITAGDTLDIEINELRQRQIPYQSQAIVSSTGMVNLPVVGRTLAMGLTVPEYEDLLVETLLERDILREPEVTVGPVFLQNATYSIFGVGVSASNVAPLRAGTFPIRRPDLRILEAINQVGGLNEFVQEIYVFRAYTPPATEDESPSNDEPENIEEKSQDEATQPAKVGRSEDAEPSASQESEPILNTDMGASEPEEADPYLWVDGEFVRNPDYKGGAVPASAPVVRSQTITAGVSWSRLAGESVYRVIRIPAQPLREGDPEFNIVVRAGDVIRITSGEIGTYYVMGQVNRVGTFAFNAEEITLKAAIAAAGGLSGLAWPERCTVYRRLGQHERMIQVNLDRIFAGKDPDFVVRRGDIINVGTHPFAPFLARIRALTLPNPVANIGYSLTYARNFADIDSFAVQPNPSTKDNRIEGLFRSAVDRRLQFEVFPELLRGNNP